MPQRAIHCEVPLPPVGGNIPRIGLEYLPPSDTAPEPFVFDAGGPGRSDFPPAPMPQEPSGPDRSPLIVSTLRTHPLRQPLTRPLSYEDMKQRWELRKQQIREIEDPVQRFTLRFLAELMGDDYKRVHRAIGMPLLGSEQRLASDPLSNYLDERDREDHQRLLTRNGTRMIRRPLRNALKELPVVYDVESAIRDIRTVNVEVQSRGRSMGRVSMRVRASHLEDPVELYWIRGGLRLASSQEYGKFSYTTQLTENLALRFRSKYDYDDKDWHLFGNLEYNVSPTTIVNLFAGNEINTISGIGTYPGGPQSDATAKGLLFCVVHLF